MAFKLAAYLTGFSSKSDGSAGIRFSTNELSASDFSVLKEHLNEFGWIIFSENQIKSEDIPKEDAAGDDEKSPSKRLKACLFVFWKQKGEVGDFNEFYRKNMETFIEVVKAKLE